MISAIFGQLIVGARATDLSCLNEVSEINGSPAECMLHTVAENVFPIPYSVKLKASLVNPSTGLLFNATQAHSMDIDFPNLIQFMPTDSFERLVSPTPSQGTERVQVQAGSCLDNVTGTSVPVPGNPIELTIQVKP